MSTSRSNQSKDWFPLIPPGTQSADHLLGANTRYTNLGETEQLTEIGNKTNSSVFTRAKRLGHRFVDTFKIPPILIFILGVSMKSYFEITLRKIRFHHPKFNTSVVLTLANAILFVIFGSMYLALDYKYLVWTSPWGWKSPWLHLGTNILLVIVFNLFFVTFSNITADIASTSELPPDFFHMLNVLLVVPAILSGHFLLRRPKSALQILSLTVVALLVIVASRLKWLSSAKEFPKTFEKAGWDIGFYSVAIAFYAFAAAISDPFAYNRRHWPIFVHQILSAPIKTGLNFIYVFCPWLKWWGGSAESFNSDNFDGFDSGLAWLAVIFQVICVCCVVWIFLNMTSLATAIYPFCFATLTFLLLKFVHTEDGTLGLAPLPSAVDFFTELVEPDVILRFGIFFSLVTFGLITEGLQSSRIRIDDNPK